MKRFAKLFAVAALGVTLHAQADTPKAGVVVMHGKGGSPSKYVSDLAASLEHRAEIRGDIANYTDITPVLQFSEVVVERSDR